MQHRKKQRKDDFHGSHNRELRRKDSEKAAEKAEEDTIAANGIPDMDDIPAINATNDTTATNTAESAATDTENTTTDTTASVPTTDVPATDTNAESR